MDALKGDQPQAKDRAPSRGSRQRSSSVIYCGFVWAFRGFFITFTLAVIRWTDFLPSVPRVELGGMSELGFMIVGTFVGGVIGIGYGFLQRDFSKHK